jgi:hypothetical protein
VELERRGTDTAYVMESLEALSSECLTERSEGERRLETFPMEAEPIPSSTTTSAKRPQFTLNFNGVLSASKQQQQRSSSRRPSTAGRKKRSPSPSSGSKSELGTQLLCADEFDVTEKEAPAASLYEVLPGDTQTGEFVERAERVSG